MRAQENRKRTLAEHLGRVPPLHLVHVVRRIARFRELVRRHGTR